MRSEKDIIEKVADARAKKRALEIVGGGTKRGFGRPVTAHEAIDVSKLSGVLLYEPEELVLTVSAGTRIAEIEAALAERGQRLGFDPADWGPLYGAPQGQATIGGVLSADACGSARARYGAARDHLLGYRAINGFAEAYKAGGRVVKNVTGFDLPKLLCGAMGTLGVLTEVTLRTTPRAPRAATLIASDVTPEMGLAILRRAWTSAFECTGLSYVPAAAKESFPDLGDTGAGVALMRLEGDPKPLREKCAGVRDLLRHHPLEEMDGEHAFRAIGDGTPFAGNSMDVWRITVPPAAAAACAREVAAPLWYADWAGGLLWMGMHHGDEQASNRIRAASTKAGGSAVLMRASDAQRANGCFPPEDNARAALTRSVKAAFDPLGLFNPGRMYKSL